MPRLWKMGWSTTSHHGQRSSPTRPAVPVSTPDGALSFLSSSQKSTRFSITMQTPLHDLLLSDLFALRCQRRYFEAVGFVIWASIWLCGTFKKKHEDTFTAAYSIQMQLTEETSLSLLLIHELFGLQLEKLLEACKNAVKKLDPEARLSRAGVIWLRFTVFKWS